MVDFSKELSGAKIVKPTEPRRPRLVWLDIETTGLVPNLGEILEIGVVVTDLELNEVDRQDWILHHPRNTTLTLMDDYVLNMHMSNGLLKEVWGVQKTNEGAGEFRARLTEDRSKKIQSIVKWIKSAAGMSPKNNYLAGSSIHFDRSWLAVHAPEILKTVSYRMVDVSTFKVAFPGLLNQPMFETVSREQHRALDDLDYSINQLAQMRKKLGL